MAPPVKPWSFKITEGTCPAWDSCQGVIKHETHYYRHLRSCRYFADLYPEFSQSSPRTPLAPVDPNVPSLTTPTPTPTPTPTITPTITPLKESRQIKTTFAPSSPLLSLLSPLSFNFLSPIAPNPIDTRKQYSTLCSKSQQKRNKAFGKALQETIDVTGLGCRDFRLDKVDAHIDGMSVTFVYKSPDPLQDPDFQHEVSP